MPCDDDGVLLPRRFQTSCRVSHSSFCWRAGGVFRNLLILAVCMSADVSSFGQVRSPQISPALAATQKRYCQQDGGFCFSYPANWLMLGESMGDGVVVAPQQTLDRPLWDEVTVAAVVPSPEENQPATSVDQLIETAMTNMKASGRDAVTLQRQQRAVAGHPAQMIRIRYHDEPSGRDWIEQLVFIEGPDQEIYSVALKAQPATISRLEPAFDAIVRSWKLESGVNSGGSQPSPRSPSKPVSSAPAPHN